ncbi:MAG: hypothetical protein FWH27_09030 [Planctomycetaceae bacterium]|nr:hypothetical protein [Planctomycetaceae bacterium]
MPDSNPWQVTFLEDEKPVNDFSGFRFVRRHKPVPCKLTGLMIFRVTWHTFRGKFWQFLGLGLLQFVMLLLSILAAYLCALPLAYFVHHVSSDPVNPPLAIVFGIPFLFFAVSLFFEFLGYAIVASGTMHLLRGEKIFRNQTPRVIVRLLTVWWNCFCYGLICLLMLLPVWVLLITSLVGLDRTGDLFASNIWLAIFCAGLILFALLGMYVFGRYAIGLHFIIDRNIGCLTALRRAADFTRGNGFTIAVSFLLHCVILVIIAFASVPFGAMVIDNTGFFWGSIIMVLGFIVMIMSLTLATVFAFLHCWLTVTYHLATGQYDQPAAPEMHEW